MKTILLTASILSISAAAHAQMVVDGGEITASGIFPTGGGFSGVSNYGIDGKVAVSFGNIGIQADLGYEVLVGQSLPNTIGNLDVGIHTYYKFNETVKAGVFYTNESIYVSGSSDASYSTFGGEIFFDFGNFDAEASIGSAGNTFASGATIVTLDSYYQINDPLALHAGVWALVESGAGGDVLGIATVGASYSLANVPVTFGLSYNAGFTFDGNASGGSIEAKVSYSFGGGGEERLFSARNIDYLSLILALSGA